MGAGHPGRPGATAAPAVELGSKCDSDPATILHPDMGVGSAWDRAERRGEQPGTT